MTVKHEYYECVVQHSTVTRNPLQLSKQSPVIPWRHEVILDAHTDEVWNVAWSHDGLRLASASKDKTAIIWRIGSDAEPSSRECVAEFTLREHSFAVGALGWSLDDSILATSADNLILLWDNTKDMAGDLRDDWTGVPIRVTDMTVSPDMERLVTVGMGYIATPTMVDEAVSRGSSRESTPPTPRDENGGAMNGAQPSDNRIIVYDLDTKAIELCFGGIDGNFVLSGSEDRNVCVWRRDTGILEVLPGHGMGSVNSVAWNPQNERMFASCSDDCTIRIWELHQPPPP
ncbi:WD40-repeat-containing domain protein [Melanogaster broomeanus]|nr:WD40-repeat-containing domain protein [Melanogaster broomeanus]